MQFLKAALKLLDCSRNFKAGSQDRHATPENDSEQRLFVLFSRPGSCFIEGDPAFVSVYNPSACDIELVVIRKACQNKRKTTESIPWSKNPTTIQLGVPGQYQIIARQVGQAWIKSNSILATCLEDTTENRQLVDQNRTVEHKLACAIQSTNTGVLTLHNPTIIPGNSGYPKTGKWFPTPVWEGATSLYNEDSSYYDDPLEYFVSAVKQLITQGVQFVTWHDVIDKNFDENKKNIILQFDIDAGVESFVTISKRLRELGIRASVMSHRQAKHWYSYKLTDSNIKMYQTLEEDGWTIGYHNNTLTNLIGFSIKSIDEELIAQAQIDMIEDIEALRKHFNVRTMTHHGGNVLNLKVPIPEEANIVCVDRSFSPDLWNQIKQSFSDGSFTARPMTLHSFVTSTKQTKSMAFMRCHPMKYGNYSSTSDVGPLEIEGDFNVDKSQLQMKIECGEPLNSIEKQTVWMLNRQCSRNGRELGDASPIKSLSMKFIHSEELEYKIAKFRSRRREGFLRQYPWQDGDPRVIWWRLMSTFCAKGAVLNVGAMPPEQKDETAAFLRDGSTLTEVDIDANREPDIVADFCDSDKCCSEMFANVLLNGLPYFSNPQAAIMNAPQYLESEGMLLVGAAAASHPERGGLFRPMDRPIWRKGAKQKDGESLSLSTTLWSFDKSSIDDLMEGWPGCWKAEFLSNYWFIVAKKESV